MVAPWRTRTWAAAILLLAAGAAFGQEASVPQPRRVVLFVTQASGAGLDADSLALAARAALLGLQADPRLGGSSGVILVEPLPGAVPTSDDARALAARAVEAQGWVWIEVLSAAADAHVRVRTYDLERGEQQADQEVDLRAGLLPLDLPSTDWSPVATLLAGGRAAPETAQKPVALATTARLLVRARPGSAVQIDGKRTTTVDTQGTGSVSLAIPAEYVIRITAQGFSPVSRSIFLTADRELTIAQVPAPRWAFEGGLADMSSPSIGLSWFPLPDFLSLGLGATTWALAFALNDKAVFASVPLTDPYVRLGIYLMPADWALRMYADVAAFVRVIHAPGVYFGLDPLAPVGLQAFVGAEIGRSLRGGVFLEYAPTIYFTSLPNLFRASLGTGGISPGWIFNPTFVVNLLSFRMGYRWLL